ncbi:MAG: HDOD domain-containing protein [Mariniblastus sp.]
MTTPKKTSEFLPSPPPELIKRLKNCENEMFVFPAVATEAINLTNDPDCSMSVFSCLVERDAKLAAEILSLANSALFTVGIPVTSIHQSLVRLGMRQCRNLILSVCISGMMKKITLEQEWVRDLLWQHSFTTATACLHLNRAFCLGYLGEEFTAGLLHDFGRTLFAVLCEEQFKLADPLDFDENEELLRREEEIIGINHCDFGAWFASQSGLPDSIADVMQWHHEPTHESENQKLVALVAAGDHIANHIQRVGEPAGYEPSENKAAEILSRVCRKNIDDNFCEISDQLVHDIYEMATVNITCKQGLVR